MTSSWVSCCGVADPLDREAVSDRPLRRRGSGFFLGAISLCPKKRVDRIETVYIIHN
jgi:hypothetical protein